MSRPVYLQERQFSGVAFEEEALLKRATEGTRTGGRFVPGATVDIEIDCATSPIAGDLLSTLPTGYRFEDLREFWVGDMEILTNRGAPLKDPDIIHYKGEDFRVIRVEDWDTEFSSMKVVIATIGQVIDADS